MNPCEPADALLDAALARLRQGDFDGAARALEDAAGQQAAQPVERARCLQLAAALRGALGHAEAASLLAGQAAAALPDDAPSAVAARVRQAEASEAAGRWHDAAQCYGAALDQARTAHLGADASIALLRARAACRIAGRAFGAAAADFDAACALAAPRIAAFLRTEHARLLSNAGAYDAARAALPPPVPGDAQLCAEIGVEHARLERAAGHWEAARIAAREARANALDAIAPVPYFAASVESAELFDALGQRADAYGSLASAWVTLADLLGEPVAKSWVEPCLLALRLRWGDAGFFDAKRTHDDRRRAQRNEAKR